MKNCQYCGYPVHDNVQFCPKCGAPQPDGQPQQQVLPQYYNNHQFNNSQATYPQQPYYGNPIYSNPQQPVINVHVNYPQQANYEKNQFGGSQMPNNGTNFQENSNSVNNQQTKSETEKTEKKNKTGCLKIGLWIFFFPIMLWIHAFKKIKLDGIFLLLWLLCYVVLHR